MTIATSHESFRYQIWEVTQFEIFSLKRLKGPDPKNPWPKGTRGEFCMIGFQGGVDCADTKVLGKFLDGSPAIIQKDLGRGYILHYSFFPGMSHWGNQFTRMTDWITLPAELAGVEPPVTVDRIQNSWPQVEAPLLLSKAGAAIILINRTGKVQPKLRINAQLPFESASVESITTGRVAFNITDDGRISFELPLNATADILKIKPVKR